jgi:methylmalonyl-CoA mutase cobalamin-binding domain/chain
VQGDLESRLRETVVEGDAAGAARLASEAVAGGASARHLVDRCLVPAMDEVGRRFEAGEYFVPELLVSARAMKAAMAAVEPGLAAGPRASTGRIAIGTVRGDLHDIGKNLVATLLRGAGFDVVDLGVDIGPERFVASVGAGAVVVALSTLLTTTMPAMQATVEALEREGLRHRAKVIVGGAPVTPEYAARIGADGFSDNAAGAVALVRQLLGATPGPRP